MNNYKEIHIWGLPKDRIYVKFNKEFREKFFSLAHKKFSNFNLVGKFLNVKRADTTLSGNWRKGMNCCPLDSMIKLANKIGIPLTELEKNIEVIRYKTKINKRGGSSGKPIINPKLPIVINENFVEILGHICGDGCISISNPKKGIGFRYINSEPALIENFQKLVKQVFGGVEPNIQVREKGNYTKPNYYLQYPSIISAFVLSVFDYKPDMNMDIPFFMFNTPKEMKVSFLRAIFDDEASVGIKKGITIGLKPIKPLMHTKMLLESIGIKTSNITSYSQESGKMWRFGIGSMQNLKLFSQLIGFKHPVKAKRLNLAIKQKRKFERHSNYKPKQKII